MTRRPYRSADARYVPNCRTRPHIMSRRLILDPDAERDLDDLFDYITQRHPTAAARYIREPRERCVLYAESPCPLGHEEPEVTQ
jgi:hypothetical protein